MKRFASLTTGLLTIMILSHCSNPAPSKKAIQKTTTDSISHMVTLSIDSGLVKTAFQDLFFYYHDSLANTHGFAVNSTTVNFSLVAPALLILADAKQTPYLIYPGEKITMRYPGTDSLQMIIPGNKERTNELNFFRKLVQKTGSVWYAMSFMPYLRKVANLSQMHELEVVIGEIKNTRLEFLNSYSQQSALSETFFKIASHTIKSTAIRDSLILYNINRDMLIKQGLYKQLATNKAASINRLGFMPFAQFYSAGVDLVSSVAGTAETSGFAAVFDFVDKNFTGLTKDFLLARTMSSASKNQVQIAKSDLDKFNAICADKGYRDQIKKILSDNSIAFVYAKGSNKLLSPYDKTVQDLDAVISKQKGKLILFDFWASWCAPCRREIPYAEQLKKNYKDKNIVFITISTDSDINGWKKAAREEGLVSENDFLLLNSDHAAFVKRYNINMIPRYMLIGKDGKVLSDDAPRPSDLKLKELINRYL